MIPIWLQHHLEDRGLWDTDGITRAVRARRCRTCREYVLAGLDANRCALPVAVDPDPLSARGEAVALLVGRSTYSLKIRSGRLEIDHRGHFEIRGDAQRDQLRHDVHASHVCGQPSIGSTGTASGLGQPSRLAMTGQSSPAAEPPF